MNYEKEYKNLVVKIKKAHQFAQTNSTKSVLEDILPQLSESEDEKIRIDICTWLKYKRENCTYPTPNKETLSTWIDYLEKQKEQKPTISNEAIREGIVHFGITQYQIDNWLKKHINIIEQKEQKSTEDVIKSITKNKEAAIKFLKSAGIMDDNGELAEMYRSEQNPAEWSEKDEEYLARIDRALVILETDSPHINTADDRKWLKSLRPRFKEELAKMLQEEYNKGKEEGERIGHTKGYNKGYKDAEEAYNKAVSYHP